MQPYVDFLARFLPVPVDHVEVHVFEGGDESVLAFAVKPDKLYFRSLPPQPHVLVHELIHLCEKPAPLDEEVYAWDLTDLVMLLAEEGVRCNPFSLFALTMDDVLAVLKRHGIGSISEYYRLVGIVPPCEPERAPERLAVLQFVIDLATPPWDALRRGILLELCAAREERTEKHK
ncbi:MAG: hypothetical protein QXO02_08190 [Thermofilaceae archaeon]